MANTHENLASLFTDIANAIREKSGISGAIVAHAFPDAIRNISSGIDTSDTTATAEDIMNGKTAYVNGQKVTGTFNLDEEIAAQDNIISQMMTALDGKAVGGSGGSKQYVNGSVSYRLVEEMYEPGVDLFEFTPQGLDISRAIVIYLQVRTYSPSLAGYTNQYIVLLENPDTKKFEAYGSSESSNAGFSGNFSVDMTNNVLNLAGTQNSNVESITYYATII